MDYLFIDTNIYVYCSVTQTKTHEPALLGRIAQVLDLHQATLLMPETVKREYEHRMQSQVQKYERNAREVWQHARQNLLAQSDKDRVRETIDNIIDDRQLAAHKAKGYFASLVANTRTAVIPLDGDVVARALGYGISGLPPSKGWAARARLDNQEHGFVVENDCLIVAALAQYLERQGAGPSDRLIVCSNNSEDFAEQDELMGQWVLAHSIADEMPCFTVYYDQLDSAVELEFTSVELTEQDKADYEDGRTAAEALLSPDEALRVSVTCPECGLDVSADEPPYTPTGIAVVCPECDRQFGLRRDRRTAQLVVMPHPRYAVDHNVRCACGHVQSISTYSDREEPVERWCFQCFNKLYIEPVSGKVIRQHPDQPHDAEVSYHSEDVTVLICPSCGRLARSFLQIQAGVFAVCNSPEHSPMLLRASKA